MSAHIATAPLLSCLVTQLIHGFVTRHGDQQLPKIVAVVQLVKPTLFHSIAEAFENIDCDIFFV